ncbi:MAG: sel1 repeat family protein [Gammaproteobacteria bacterium]|nr:sel1 repeat family protein [Gammaproteobacteria bacterium]
MLRLMQTKPHNSLREEKAFKNETISTDIMGEISSFLSVYEKYAIFARIDKQSYSIVNQTYLLQDNLNNDFGLKKECLELPFFYEKKSEQIPQLQAKYLHKKTILEKKSSEKYHANAALFQFLKPHSQKKWAQFYLAELYLTGEDYLENNNKEFIKNKAKNHLYTALTLNDYRAAQLLLSITLDHPDSENAFKNFLTPDMIKLLEPCLMTAFKEKHASNIARNIGYLHLKGLGVPTDLNKAEYFFLYALHEEKNPEAIRDLKTLYSQPMFYTELLPFLEIEYKNFSDPIIAIEIALLHQDNKNYSTAYTWFLKAADKKNAHAASYIANLYFEGSAAIPIDKAKAKEWLEKAFEYGLIYYARHIAEFLLIDELPHSCKENETQIDEAIIWFKKGFFAGDEEACHQLAHFFMSQHNWNQNDSKVWWVLTSAYFGSEQAYNALANTQDISILSSYAVRLLSLNINDMKDVIQQEIKSFISAGEKENIIPKKIKLLLNKWQEKETLSYSRFSR